MNLTKLIEKYADHAKAIALIKELSSDNSLDKFSKKIELWLMKNKKEETNREGMSYILSVRNEIISELGYNSSSKDKILIEILQSIENQFIIPTVRDMIEYDIKDLNSLLNNFKPFEYKTNREKGGRPKGVSKRTINRYIKVYHQYIILKKKYTSKTKAELYELLAAKDYDGKSYKRNTIRNIIEDKKYNLTPSQ